MAIRYDKKLSREIRRTVTNFNAKVRRLEKLQRELIPSRVSVASLKEEFTSRSDLQRKLKELQSFSKRGAEDIITTEGGVRTTRYEFKLTKERARIAKIRLSREIRILGEATPIVYGKHQPRKFVEMGSEELSNLQARREKLNKNIETMSKKQWERYQDLIDKTYKRWDTKQGKIYRESYYKILRDAGYAAGANPEDIEKIINGLEKLSQTQLGAAYDSDRNFKKILNGYIGFKLQGAITSTSTADAIEELAKNIDELVSFYA